MGPENSSPFDRLAERYDAWFDNEGSLVFAIEVKAFRSILHQLPKPWLEVGVGSGRFAQALGIENGIDPSAELLQMAEKRGVQSHRGRGEDLPFVDESFGTVFLIVTICFLDSPADVLEEIHRVLHPKGKLVLGLVLRESAWGRFYAAQKEQGHPFYRYARFFTYEEMESMLTESRFRIERTTSTLFQMPWEVITEEDPRKGYSPDAGFTIIVARKAKG